MSRTEHTRHGQPSPLWVAAALACTCLPAATLRSQGSQMSRESAESAYAASVGKVISTAKGLFPADSARMMVLQLDSRVDLPVESRKHLESTVHGAPITVQMRGRGDIGCGPDVPVADVEKDARLVVKVDLNDAGGDRVFVDVCATVRDPLSGRGVKHKAFFVVLRRGESGSYEIASPVMLFYEN